MLLRKTAEQTLFDMVVHLFGRLEEFLVQPVTAVGSLDLINIKFHTRRADTLISAPTHSPTHI